MIGRKQGKFKSCFTKGEKYPSITKQIISPLKEGEGKISEWAPHRPRGYLIPPSSDLRLFVFDGLLKILNRNGSLKSYVKYFLFLYYIFFINLMATPFNWFKILFRFASLVYFQILLVNIGKIKNLPYIISKTSFLQNFHQGL